MYAGMWRLYTESFMFEADTSLSCLDKNFAIAGKCLTSEWNTNVKAPSLVVGDLDSETKGSQFISGC